MYIAKTNGPLLMFCGNLICNENLLVFTSFILADIMIADNLTVHSGSSWMCNEHYMDNVEAGEKELYLSGHETVQV